LNGHKSAENVRLQLLEALERRRVTPDFVAMRLKQLMSAKVVKAFKGSDDRIIYSERLVDNTTRLHALTLAVDIMGGKAPTKSELEGTVAILKPDPTIKKKRE